MNAIELLTANIKKLSDDDLAGALDALNGLREQAHAQAHAVVKELARRGQLAQIDQLVSALPKEDRAALKKRL